jgi:hypothetical protein
MQGIKHLIKCKCILPHLKGLKEPVFHSFVVFSVLADDDSVLEKFATCNNCGITHRVHAICESEVLDRENSSAVITIKDISLLIPTELVNVLTAYDCDVPTWEFAHFLHSNARWGESLVLTRVENLGVIEGKRLTIVGPNSFRIEPYTYTEMV